MSNIADIREPFVKPLFENTKEGKKMIENPERNYYYQGYLDEEGANYIAGYDYAVEQTFTNFLYNLNIWLDDFEECGFDDIRMDKFNKQFQEFVERESTDNPMDLESVKDCSVKLILTLYRRFQEYAEMERDEVGVGLINSMSDEEKEQCRRLYEDGYKNLLLRLEEDDN